eukprot:5721973-Heterocapsa_arctica.AAC.1
MSSSSKADQPWWYGCAGKVVVRVPCFAKPLVQHLVPYALVPVHFPLIGVALRWGGVLLLLFGLVLRIAVASRNAKS